MSIGPTSEPHNFPPPPPVTPSEGPIDVPGSDGAYRTPAVPNAGPSITPGMPDTPDIEGPGNNAGPIVQPGDPQPDSPIGIMSAPPGVANDAGSSDVMVSTVAGAIAAAMAREVELQSDLYGTGSHVGDAMALPDVPSDFGKASGGSNGPLPSVEIQDI